MSVNRRISRSFDYVRFFNEHPDNRPVHKRVDLQTSSLKMLLVQHPLRVDNPDGRLPRWTWGSHLVHTAP